MTWIEDAQAALEMETGQGCDAGHDSHQTLVTHVQVPDFEGPMTVFDAEVYLDTHGYCPGDDCVSRTLILYGVWEAIETRMFTEALHRSPGLVIDFGSQIGWYSMLATAMGHDALAIEAVAEHEHMTWINASDRGGTLWQAQHWLDENTPTLPALGAPQISVVKMDIEGAERHAMRCIRELLDAELVPNVLMEVSPTFNDSYPALVSDLLNRGFRAVALNPIQPVTLNNYLTILETIPQVDVMFSL